MLDLIKPPGGIFVKVGAHWKEACKQSWRWLEGHESFWTAKPEQVHRFRMKSNIQSFCVALFHFVIDSIFLSLFSVRGYRTLAKHLRAFVREWVCVPDVWVRDLSYTDHLRKVGSKKGYCKTEHIKLRSQCVINTLSEQVVDIRLRLTVERMWTFLLPAFCPISNLCS